MTQACKVAFWRQENIWNQRMESISLIFKILGCTFTVVLLQLHQFLKKSNQYYLLLCLLFYNLYYSKFSQIRCILFLFIVLEIINCGITRYISFTTHTLCVLTPVLWRAIELCPHSTKVLCTKMNCNADFNFTVKNFVVSYPLVDHIRIVYVSTYNLVYIYTL